MADVTELLMRWADGDREALASLIPVVYDELVKIASRLLKSERRDFALETRSLVHEAYLRLVDQRQPRWDGRTQFYGAAANVMRRVLVDQARRRVSAKRGGGVLHEDLDGSLAVTLAPDLDLLALDQALDSLAAIDADRARVVEMRYFAGMSLAETAEALGISPQAVSRDWAVARAWLARHLQDTSGGRRDLTGFPS
jgi:RNA polymerase sigma factor (TIGR02999 family)